MPSDIDWVLATITKARQRIGGVPESVWVRVGTALKGRFSERPLPAAELAKIAEQLIQEMTSAPSKVGKPG
jgi:hypothetical protein